LDEEKSNGASLAQENSFVSTQLPTLLPWLAKKGATQMCTSRKECNEYDLTAAQYL
jgi:hypothetical protein